MGFSDIYVHTLQEINISHLGKRKIIFKYALSGGYVNSLEGNPYIYIFDGFLECPFWSPAVGLEFLHTEVLRPSPLMLPLADCPGQSLGVLFRHQVGGG